MSGPAVVVLAAGEGRRLRPLTLIRPKPLCPVGNVALLDLAVARAEVGVGPLDPATLAVNAHHLADLLVAHVGDRAHVSVEMPEALGTAGALGRLRPWIDGRDVLVCNGDAWLDGELTALVEGWDGAAPRLLVVEEPDRADFGGRWRFAGASLLPWQEVERLEARPSGLFEAVWRRHLAAGTLQLTPTDARFVDCGTPAEYLTANLLAGGGGSVVEPGATVLGEVVRSVVWAPAVVGPGERLVDAIRAVDPTTGDQLTVDAVSRSSTCRRR